MEPNYAGFWAAFKGTDAWQGLMAMGRHSDAIELWTLRLRVEMLDAINGDANQADIQESIWRLMSLSGSLALPAELTELLDLMDTYGLSSVYTLTP
jgi:hypothetical protein